MPGLKRNSFVFHEILGVCVFVVCIFTSFLFNIGSIWEKQLHGPSFHLTCLIASAIIFFVWILKNAVFSINLLDIYVMFYIGYMVFRTIQTSHSIVNHSQLYSYLSYATIYLLVRTIHKPEKFGRGIIFVIIFAAIVNVLVVVLQLLLIFPIANSLKIVSGLFVNPGSLGGFIASTLLLTFAFKATNPEKQLVKVTLILIFGVTLILTSSRTAWISAAVPVLIYFVPWSKIFNNKYLWIYLAIILCFVAFILYKLYSLNPLSVQGRILIWKVSFQMFYEKPIFGYGAGGFAANYNSFQGLYFASSSGTLTEKMLASTVYIPFNEYLKILIEGGLIGLLLFIMIIVQWARAIRTATTDNMPVFLSIFSFLIFSLFSYPFAVESTGCLFFALVALIPAKTVIVKSVSPKFASIFIPVYLVLSAPVFRSIYSIEKWRKASPMWDYNEYQALQEYNQISRDLSSNWAFMYNYGAELLRNGHTIEAVDILLQCKSLGDNVLINNQLGQAYAALEHYQQAEHYFRKSSNMVPNMLSQKFALFKLYEKTKNWKKYLETAQEIERTPIKIANDEALLIKNETQISILNYKKKKNAKQI